MSIFKQPRFINRESDFQSISQKISGANRDINKIIILHGNSGIGKSRFIRELFARMFFDSAKINIPTLGTENVSIDSLFFFNRLYEELILYYKKNPYSHAKYSFNGVGLGALIFSINASFQKTNIFDQDTIKRFNTIIKILSKKKIRHIIDFENAQLFDAASFKMLINILKRTEGNCYIFEYTTNPEQDFSQIFKIVQEFEVVLHDVEIEVYELKSLNFNDARKIFENMYVNDRNMNTLQHIYSTSHGNLFNLLLYRSIEDSSELSNAIEFTLQNLSNTEMLLLKIIYLNKGMIKLSELYKIIEQDEMAANIFGSINILNDIKNLIDKNMLSRKINSLAVKHDSILKELDKSRGDVLFFNAYRIIENFYYRKRESEDSVLMLLYLYTLTNDPRVTNIIPNIRHLALTQRYPEAISEKLNLIYESLVNFGQNRKQLLRISIAIIDILYISGHYKEAYDRINEIFDPNNPLHVAYKGAILALRNGENDIPELKQLIEKCKNSPRLKLILEAHLLISYMETKQMNQSKKLALIIINNDSYKEYIEYIFVLKNYSEFENNEDAITTLTRCIEEYKKINRPDYASRCMLSIASRYAYMGELTIAENLVQNIVCKEDDRFFKHEYLLNNRAAIQILKKNFGKETKKLLYDALLICLHGYERIIIKCNLLIYHSFNHEYEFAQDIAKELENDYESSCYRYEEILHILIYNLRYFYLTFNIANGIKNCNLRLERLRDLSTTQELVDYIDSTLIERQIIDPKHQWGWYSQLPYRPDFLGYWQFEIPYDISFE